MTKFLHKKMLPTELTSEQKQLPDLTEKQLQDLGFKSNHEWKLNAEMLGFSLGTSFLTIEEFIEEFIEKKTEKSIKTFLTGKQIDIYEFSDNVSLDSYPIAFEGDVIISERSCLGSGDWRDTKFFSIDSSSPTGSHLIRSGLLKVDQLRFQLVYGKYRDQHTRAKGPEVPLRSRAELPTARTESACARNQHTRATEGPEVPLTAPQSALGRVEPLSATGLSARAPEGLPTARTESACARAPEGLPTARAQHTPPKTYRIIPSRN